MLKVIQDTIDASKIKISEEELLILFPKIKEFIKVNDRKPNINSFDPLERRMAEAVIYINNLKRQRNG